MFLFYHDLISRLGALAVKGGFFGEGSGPILLDNVQCQGGENALLQCASEDELGQHNCGHHQDAGVLCPGKSMETEVVRWGGIGLGL